MLDAVYPPNLPRALIPALLLALLAPLPGAAPLQAQVPAQVQAQDTPPDPGELIGDRPDATESAAVVPAGFFQLETGVLFTREDDGGQEVDVFEGPGTLARIGLGGRTELRLGWAGVVEVDADGETDGVADAELGAKTSLRTGEAGGPAVAFLAGVSLPVGDDELTSDRYDPSFRLAVGHDLSDRVSLGYNLGMAWSSELTGDDEAVRETFSRFVYTAALGFALGERLGAFAEVFGEEPVDAPGSSAVSVDGGFTYLVRRNVQLDLFGGAGLTDEAADWFVGTGLVVRWPR